MLSCALMVTIGPLRRGIYTFTVGYTFTSSVPVYNLHSGKNSILRKERICTFSSAIRKSTSKLSVSVSTSSRLRAVSRCTLSSVRRAESQIITSSKYFSSASVSANDSRAIRAFPLKYPVLRAISVWFLDLSLLSSMIKWLSGTGGMLFTTAARLRLEGKLTSAGSI